MYWGIYVLETKWELFQTAAWKGFVSCQKTTKLMQERQDVVGHCICCSISSIVDIWMNGRSWLTGEVGSGTRFGSALA